jgi:hypothetical protein
VELMLLKTRSLVLSQPKVVGGFLCKRASLNVRLAALLLAILPGCIGFGGRGLWHRDPLAGAPRPRFSADPQMEEVVDYLNRNVDKLHGWQANRVGIRANNMPLSGTLAVENGQHLRLVVHSLAGNEVDMGSNNDVFWIWAKRMDPAYVYCRHEQIDDARQTLGIPFEPDWMMQALGVAPLDTKDLTMQIDRSAHHARLVQQVVSAHGYPMQKVVLVDLTRGVVLEHSILDSRGKTIALARLEDHHVDKASGAVIARRIHLDWPQNKMNLVMNFGQIEVNPRGIPSQVWDMPKMPGVQAVDLGDMARSGTRTVENASESAVQLRGLEMVDDGKDDAGRVRLSGNDRDVLQSDAIEFKSAQGQQTSGQQASARLGSTLGKTAQPQSSTRQGAAQQTPTQQPSARQWWDDDAVADESATPTERAPVLRR